MYLIDACKIVFATSAGAELWIYRDPQGQCGVLHAEKFSSINALYDEARRLEKTGASFMLALPEKGQPQRGLWGWITINVEN